MFYRGAKVPRAEGFTSGFTSSSFPPQDFKEHRRTSLKFLKNRTYKHKRNKIGCGLWYLHRLFLVSSWVAWWFKLDSCITGFFLYWFFGIVVLGGRPCVAPRHVSVLEWLVPVTTSVVCGVEWVGADVREVAGVAIGMLLLDHDAFWIMLDRDVLRLAIYRS